MMLYFFPINLTKYHMKCLLSSSHHHNHILPVPEPLNTVDYKGTTSWIDNAQKSTDIKAPAM